LSVNEKGDGAVVSVMQVKQQPDKPLPAGDIPTASQNHNPDKPEN